MTDHFANLQDRFIYGQGKRWRVECKPCRWTSQWHRTSRLANDDYTAHCTPRPVFVEPTDTELVGYGLHPALVTGADYGTDPRGRRRD